MKKIITIIMSFFIIMFSISNTYLPFSHLLHHNYVYAEEDKSKKDFLEKTKDYTKDTKGTEGLLDKVYKDNDVRKREDTVLYALKRILDPTFYVYDVREGVFGSSDKKKKLIVDETVRLENGTVCTDDEPQNLLNHNCDIPNVIGEVTQAVGDIVLSSGIQNGVKTSSKSAFNFGVPNGLPGNGEVPVDAGSRTSKYTALELYGYDLSYTEYKGEWDRITTATAARLMSNFGLFDSFKVAGKAAFNGVKSSFKAIFHTKNFSWNPVKWIGNILSAGVGGALNAIIDSSDLNIVSTHAWLRPNFPLYNVGTLSNKDIITASQKDYYDKLPKYTEEFAMKNPEVKEMFELEKLPEFKYDPQWEKGESKKAREEAIEHNKINPESPISVPEPQYFTEEEQFGFYKKDNGHDEFFAKAKKRGMSSCVDKKNYKDLQGCWGDSWNSMAENTMDHNKDVMKEAEEDAKDKYLSENPHFNPGDAISHYVCLDENDEIIGKKDYKFKWYYTKHNTRSEEFTDGSCKPPRPSIKGGLFGTGDREDFNDTRRQVFEASHGWSSIFSPFTNIAKNLTGTFQGFGQLFAKISNELLNFSFSSILTALGITTIIEELIKNLRESFYFPLITLAMAFSGMTLLYRIIKTQNTREFTAKIIAIFLTFFLGIVLLTKPAELVNFVEKYPTKIDNAIMNVITNSNKPNDICAANGSDKDGVRTIQCTVWKISVFDPWVNGQFGVGYNQLFAKGHSGPRGNSSFNNNNENIVGDAGVNMGGGQVEHNWALYQLDKMKSGTINKEDPKEIPGTLDKNLYRLVDLQAGPKNGQDSDGRFLYTWSDSPATRLLYSVLGSVASLTSLVVIGGLAILKIEYTLMFTALLILIPIQLLLGLFGVKGNYKFIEYFSTLIAVFIKRTMVVVLMAVLLNVMRIISDSPLTYSLSFVFIMATLVGMMLYRTEMLGWLSPGAKGDFAEFVANPKQMSKMVMKAVPQSARFAMGQWKAGLIGGTGGVIGGALGRTKGMKQAKKEELKDLKSKGKLDKNSAEYKELKERYSGNNLLVNALKGGVTGMRRAQAQQDARYFNRARRKGQLGILNVRRSAINAVQEDAIQKILSKPSLTASYLQIAKHSDYLSYDLIQKLNQDMETKNNIYEDIHQAITSETILVGKKELDSLNSETIRRIMENEKIQMDPTKTEEEKEVAVKAFAQEIDAIREQENKGVKRVVRAMKSPGQAFDTFEEARAIKQHKADAAKEQLMPTLDSFAEKIEKEQEKTKNTEELEKEQEETKGEGV